MRRHLIRGFIVFAVALSASRLSAQEPRAAVAPIRESVELNVMTLDVTVTGPDRKPVNGLPKEAFVVEVDGKPMEVSWVDEIRRGTRPAIPSPDQLEKVAAGATPVAPAELTVPRYVSIFVDSRSLALGSRSRALSALRDFVLKLGPDDQAMLLNFNTDLSVVRPYTTSKEALLAGLSEIGTSDIGGLRRIARQRSAYDRIRLSRSKTRRASLADEYAREVAIQNRELISALATALRDLGGAPGRKALLYLSEGFETRPGEQLVELAIGRFGSAHAAHRESSVFDIAELAKKANASGVAIYTVEASGLSVTPGGEAEFQTGTDDLGNSGLAAKSNLTDGMRMISAATGGASLLDANDLTAGLDRVHDELSNFYELGIKLSPGDDVERYRRVAVSVRARQKIEVHARNGWSGTSPLERTKRVIEAAFATGRPMKELTLRLETRILETGGLFSDPEVGISVALPASQVTWLPDGGKSRAKLVVFIEAIDDRGDRSDLVTRDWNAEAPATAGEPIHLELRMKVRKGNNRIMVAVRDSATEKTGIAEYPIRVE